MAEEEEMSDDSYEPELQFVLRLPPTQSEALKEDLSSGVDLDEKFSIEFEEDLRNATIKYDKWTLPAKLYDLPTIAESSKTLDDKIFYKTGDICQIMIAEEDDVNTEEGASSIKKDKHKKDKRYFCPHGLTPPLKNVRKQRHRKTFKQKNFDIPDTENEVRRLLEADADAYSFHYEIVDAGDENADPKGELEDDSFVYEETGLSDIFGDLNSSSDDTTDEVDNDNEDARSSEEGPDDEADGDFENEYAQKLESIFEDRQDSPEDESKDESKDKQEIVDIVESVQHLIEDRAAEHVGQLGENNGTDDSYLESAIATENLDQLLKEQTTEDEIALNEKLVELEETISSLRAKRRAQELEVENIENNVLKEKFESSIEQLKKDEFEKQQEYDQIANILQQGV
ncbi:transcription initiation factor TFIID subunit 7 [Caerostris darwini]|uniref:Transcription initiation factor TFIID subunit 7 n=1 Tax=Caerostris darwini TaxID=1538125 RepID=A0AAV4QLC1_9ARAC|nr:transcription initiation factor TFIID subunit 7 [Caerostris darwini]